MKGITLLLTLSIFLCLVSCDKKENTTIDIESPFKAVKNGANWVSTSSGAIFLKTEKRFYISGTKVYPGEEVLHISFYLSDIPKSNNVVSFYSELNYMAGGDAIYDSYQIDSTSNNLVQITSLDTIGKQISGTFLIKLIRDKLRSDRGEVIQFTHGQFDLQYKEFE